MADILPFSRAAAGTDTMPDPLPMPAPPPDLSPEGGVDSGPLWGELMQRAQAGDQAAYHTLLHAITPYLRAIMRHYLGRAEDAEDAVQDVLMIVHGIRHTYEPGRPFKPWLSTLATRRCIDLLRRRAHRLKHEIDHEAPVDDQPHGSPEPDDALQRQHAAAALREAIATLPPRQREAVRLLRLNELSLQEAAAQSDQSIGSLKVACHRALKALQDKLTTKGGRP